LNGLKKFLIEGLEPPKAIKEATDEYQRNSDKAGNFISECLEKIQGENCKAGDVYSLYQKSAKRIQGGKRKQNVNF